MVATALKPSGRRVSLSPCEFQTCNSRGKPSNNRQRALLTRSVPLPYSRFWPRSTLPLRNLAITCNPKQMPSTGTPRSKIDSSGSGAALAYTLDGPPERMMPLGFIFAISAAGVL